MISEDRYTDNCVWLRDHWRKLANADASYHRAKTREKATLAIMKNAPEVAKRTVSEREAFAYQSDTWKEAQFDLDTAYHEYVILKAEYELRQRENSEFQSQLRAGL